MGGYLHSTPALSVSPSSPVSSSGSAGGPFTPTLHSFVLSNGGLGTLSWTASCDVGWITFSATSGTIGTNRSTSVVATIDADANALAAGTHVANVTFTNATNGTGTTSRTVTLVVSSASAVMHPGAGWSGATAEPGQIGTGTAKCIARFDVVPHQVITEATTPLFSVGVVAFHIAGIEKVSFGVEGGTFVDVTAQSVNPHTGVMEYCCQLALSDFGADGEVEIRAIAYPNAAAPQAAGTGAYAGGGYPRLLSGLKLWLDVDTARTPLIKYASANTGSDSTGDGTEALPYASVWKAAQAVDAAGGADDANGGFVYLSAGSYTWDQPGAGTLPPTSTRWLTIQPKPGVQPWEVVFNTASSGVGLGIHKVKLYGVTIKKRLANSGTSDIEVWADRCLLTGSNDGVSVGGFLGDGTRYYTECEQFGEVGGPVGKIVRNCTISRSSYGVGGNDALYVGNSFDTLTDYGNSNIHPDWCTWNFRHGEVQDNAIIYGNVGLNMNAQGYFWKDTFVVQNIAIVNNVAHLVGSAGSPFGEGACNSLNHFLFWNNTHLGTWTWYDVNQISFSNVSVRGNVFSNMSTAYGGPPQDSWCDQNHITGGQWNTITPGTNVTTGDPGLDADFRPVPGSVLNGRMSPLVVPIDLDGEVRTVAGSVGAYETDAP